VKFYLQIVNTFPDKNEHIIGNDYAKVFLNKRSKQ